MWFRTNSSTRWITGQAPTVQDVFSRVDSEPYTAANRVAGGGYFESSVQVDNSDNYWGNALIKSGNLERQQELYVPRAEQSFLYDESGNQTGDGVLEYRYDAENRLVAIIYPNGFHRVFLYDYRSRRVQEHLLHYPSDVIYGMWYYVYDDWRIVAEIDTSVSANNGITKTFIWGLDTASSGGAATGNIGGLYGIDDWTSGKQYQVGYDGMGNVSMLIDAQSGKLAAGMEYSPFGELVRASGEYAVTPFRYSTKWHLEYGPAGDHVNWSSDFYDYGLRVYTPTQGRFLNRDPIGDAGGSNLYGFVGNDPVNRADVLGLCWSGETSLGVDHWGNDFCVPHDFTLEALWDPEIAQMRGLWGMDRFGMNISQVRMNDGMTVSEGFRIGSSMPYSDLFFGSTRYTEKWLKERIGIANLWNSWKEPVDTEAAQGGYVGEFALMDGGSNNTGSIDSAVFKAAIQEGWERLNQAYKNSGDSEEKKEILKFRTWLRNFINYEPDTWIRLYATDGVSQFKGGYGYSSGVTLIGELFWNPNSTIGWDGSYRSPTVALFHELWHAYDWQTLGSVEFRRLHGISDPVFLNLIEARAVRAENWIRNPKGFASDTKESIRWAYGPGHGG